MHQWPKYMHLREDFKAQFSVWSWMPYYDFVEKLSYNQFNPWSFSPLIIKKIYYYICHLATQIHIFVSLCLNSFLIPEWCYNTVWSVFDVLLMKQSVSHDCAGALILIINGSESRQQLKSRHICGDGLYRLSYCHSFRPQLPESRAGKWCSHLHIKKCSPTPFFFL